MNVARLFGTCVLWKSTGGILGAQTGISPYGGRDWPFVISDAIHGPYPQIWYRTCHDKRLSVANVSKVWGRDASGDILSKPGWEPVSNERS